MHGFPYDLHTCIRMKASARSLPSPLAAWKDLANSIPQTGAWGLGVGSGFNPYAQNYKPETLILRLGQAEQIEHSRIGTLVPMGTRIL